MILGYEPDLSTIEILGLVVFTLLVLQILIGMRIIKFKGKLHRRVHKYGAWVTLAVAVVHGLLALAYVNGWSILS